MNERSLLLVCDDSLRAEELYLVIQPHLGRFSMQVATSSEALGFDGLATASLVLIDLRTANSLGDLLDRCEDRPAPIPVVALGDTYDKSEALALFQRGVTDYLSISDHLGQFSSVLDEIDRQCRLAQESRIVSAGADIV